VAIPYLACMAMVAANFHLPPRVLPSIQRVEGGAVGTISRNANGTADLGVMQVNTIWIPPLATVTRQPPAMVARRLVFDPCFNIVAAGMILRAHLVARRGNLMEAIGDYHSMTPMLGARYRVAVLEAARTLFFRLDRR